MPRPMLRVPPRKYYYTPFKTQVLGFNTEFSLEECRRKEKYGKLNAEELIYIDYLRSIGKY